MTSSTAGDGRHLTRRIFISSTSYDLRAHRDRVRDTLLSLGLFPVGMEHFGAQGTGDATSISTDKVASCDAYLGIIAWRYGYVPAGAARSVTHEEYEEAIRLRLPRYIFLAAPVTDASDGPDALFPADLRDPEHRAQLEAFRAEIGQSHVVDFFTTPEDLAARVATALNGYLLQLKEEELTRGPRPPRDLPPRAPEFVGRERELEALCDMLGRGKGSSVSAAVAGMAGVGKSALAAEAVHRLAADQSAFPGGVTWVRCDGRSSLPGLTWIYDQLLSAWGYSLSPEELARATNPEAEVHLRERTLRARLRPRDQTTPAAPALALLDNVERDLPIGRALDALAPLGIAVLLTARHEPSSARLRLLPLDVLAPEPAIQLFAERYGDRGGSWDAARDGAPTAAVVEALGRLPLAIELAAARAARSRTGTAALAAELREADRLGRLRDPLDPTRSVRYAFEQSLALLNTIRRARFAALGLPDGPDWPRAVIERVLAAVPDGADAATPAGDDLDLLAALSLVTLDASGAVPRVRLHPLLRELAREEWGRLPAATQTACLEALLAGIGDLVWAQGRDFAALAREEELIAGTLRRAAQAGADPGQVGETIDALEQYLDIGGHWRLGQELSALQLAACRAMGDRVREGRARNNLGVLSFRLGETEDAARSYEEALAIRRAVGDRAGEGETLSNLGGLARAQGHPDRAVPYYEQALAIRREVSDRRGEGTILNNLGALANDLGHPDEAQRYYEQALAIQREVGDRAGEGITRNNLGALAESAGRGEEAASHYEQALAILRQAGDRGGEGTILNNLGNLARAQGRTEEATGYYQQALAIRRAVGDRAGEGTTLHNLGVLTENLKRPEEAKRFFEQALAVEREASDRAGEGATLSNLGLLERALGHSDEAATYFEQALAIQRELGDRTGEGATYNNLGELARSQGRKAAAMDYFEQALAIQRAMSDRRREGITLNNLGLLAYGLGRKDEATRYFEQALPILEAVGAGDSAEVVRENLAGLVAQRPAAAVPSLAPSQETVAPLSPPPAMPAPSAPDSAPAAESAPPAQAGRPRRRWWPWAR